MANKISYNKYNFLCFLYHYLVFMFHSLLVSQCHLHIKLLLESTLTGYIHNVSAQLLLMNFKAAIGRHQLEDVGGNTWKYLSIGLRSIEGCHMWANDPWTWPKWGVCLQVKVILSKTEGMCSVAFSGPHRQLVSVPASSSKLITYTIIPLKTGELPIQVTAVAHSYTEPDAVRKNLHVVVSS